ncbi:hypothetical protein [Crystallibacter degradans]|uniref:hypothetical protein n=1 Tax=Crystallibacter degradans TaxID=2726743 RepID=UPI001475FE3A|nr:hypothetical protein [Arthrobacter sp. SF27]NMR29934.1 hypothetical protein [Arthrobacter sp. SF27]
MGASNVAKVFEHWNHLDHRNARGLAYMANVSMDGDTPPVYWGGWESLAKAVGQTTEDKPETARRTAVRVLSALCKAGALVSSGQARPGVRAEYAVTLDPDHTFKPAGKGKEISWSKVERAPRRETPTVPPPETVSVPPPETPTVPTWDSYGPEPETARCTPRNNTQEQHKEQLEEQQIGTQASKSVDSPAADPDEAPLLDEEIPIDDPEELTLEENRARQAIRLVELQAEYEKNMREAS